MLTCGSTGCRIHLEDEVCGAGERFCYIDINGERTEAMQFNRAVNYSMRVGFTARVLSVLVFTSCT